MPLPQIDRALISVSDKIGLADFARSLVRAGVEIYSTGGTRTHLQSEGIPVIDVSAYTGFPEMMDGRVKTLHPKVHGGILCRRDNPEDMKSLAEHGILSFELVVVNLYPFEATIARKGVTWDEAVEQIDIGGPSLVRAAAKNHAFVTIVTDPTQYVEVIEQLRQEGGTTLELRKRFAAEAYAHTANYDRVIADYFAGETSESPFPATIRMNLKRKAVLRYGENPHQQAAVYVRPECRGASIVSALQLNGKELSYNNLLDLDAALRIVRAFSKPACAVLKHNNPCGAAEADSIGDAVRRAMEGDPSSAFGSILGINRVVDAAAAEYLCTPGLFVEAIVAPDFSPEALELLTTKPKWKSNVRLMKVGDLEPSEPHLVFRCIEGGALAQDSDVLRDPEDVWQVVTEAKPDPSLLDDLRFAWEMVRHVKSNAIVLCKDKMLLGAGAGQMSRVDSVKIAIEKAGQRSKDSVLGSDAFFPFPRLNRSSGGGGRNGYHSARRLEKRSGGDRGMQQT